MITEFKFSKNANLSIAAFWETHIPEPTALKDKREQEFQLGRMCSALCLEAVGFSKDEAHRRAFTTTDLHQPDWPEGFWGSVTHTKGSAACALISQSEYQSIGLDREHDLSSQKAKNLSRKILSPQECNVLKGLDDYPLIAFSAKESLYKAIYPFWRKTCYFSQGAIVSWNDSRLDITLSFYDDAIFPVFYERQFHWIQTICVIPRHFQLI